MASSTKSSGALFGLPAFFGNNLSMGATESASGKPGFGRFFFALTFMGLGILGLTSGSFAEVWQPVPKGVPAQTAIAYLCAIIMLAGGVGLFWKRSVTLATRLLFAYLLLWVLLLEIWPIVQHPGIEAMWAGCGEIVVVLAGTWTLFALNAGPWERAHLGFATGARGQVIARLLLGLAIIAIGFEHILYAKDTADYVPKWIPGSLFWAYLTGVGHVAAGFGVLFGVYPRLAAMMEAQMMNVFTLLVWVPFFFLKPPDHFQWTGFFISNLLAFGVWVVADSYRGSPWLSIGKSKA